jgi:hypothetical protein
MDQFHAANVALSLAGHVVYSVATSTKGDFQPTEDQKIALDAVHLSKIEASDAVMIVGIQEDGSVYIGDSTRREMMYARLRDKPIYFYNPDQKVLGPTADFENDLKGAAMTRAEHEAQKRAEEDRRAEYLKTFQTDDDGEIDHSGDPKSPAATSEETH